MISRSRIEEILKVNGASESSPDEVIRSVLLSARYDNEEIDTAIMVLRKNIKTNKTRIEGLHKVFRTDQALKPDEISQLLGIDVSINNKIEAGNKSRKMSVFQLVFVWIFSIILALLSILMYMYLYHLGPFYPTNIY